MFWISSKFNSTPGDRCNVQLEAERASRRQWVARAGIYLYILQNDSAYLATHDTSVDNRDETLTLNNNLTSSHEVVGVAPMCAQSVMKTLPCCCQLRIAQYVVHHQNSLLNEFLHLAFTKH
eukprot:TRINITY_DN5877_c0_g1_i4.p2 TRINITY_DN5877_c0_g1~~TRINITY_DN5877_c0_g1_i4.p2  ORF type:complete len:121 (+),score=10.43 TRINITY_DN5877_c0_g1_i4:961-1323(+)